MRKGIEEEGRNQKFLRLSPENRKKMWKGARFALYALVVFLVLISLFGGDFSLIARYRYKRYEKIFERQLRAEQAKQDSLNRVLERLKTDSEYLERLARERHFMIKDGERVYIFK